MQSDKAKEGVFDSGFNVDGGRGGGGVVIGETEGEGPRDIET